MQRVIKFRQFIGGKMQFWGFIDGAFFGPSSNGTNAQNAQNTPQMQFTGLLDKSGKEIWEGDVLQNDDGARVNVVFEDGAYWFKFDAENGFTYDWLRQENGKLHGWKHLENPLRAWNIIGNIYESPQLLTSKEE